MSMIMALSDSVEGFIVSFVLNSERQRQTERGKQSNEFVSVFCYFDNLPVYEQRNSNEKENND